MATGHPDGGVAEVTDSRAVAAYLRSQLPALRAKLAALERAKVVSKKTLERRFTV